MIICVWVLNARMQRATEAVFEKIDGTLVVVRDKVTRTQDRVESAKITSDDIKQTLTEWTTRKAGERLADRLKVAEKTDRLASAIAQADHWLEVSESAVQVVQQALAIGTAAGASVDAAPVDELGNQIRSFRGQLDEAGQLVEQIREQTNLASEDQPLQRALQLTVRLAATVGSIDSHLAEFQSQLADTQQNIQGLARRTMRSILFAVLAATFLLVWMAAGQLALFVFGWNPA